MDLVSNKKTNIAHYLHPDKSSRTLCDITVSNRLTFLFYKDWESILEKGRRMNTYICENCEKILEMNRNKWR